MREPQEPLFLARRTYRQRRLMDAARLLPWAGTLLFFVPLLWRDATTATGLLYLFAVWIVLIGASWALSHGLSRTDGWSRESESSSGEG